MKVLFPLSLATLLAAFSLSGHCDTTTTSTTTTTTQTAPTSSSYNFDDHLSGTVDIVTNYVYRGVTQTDNGPAFQPGLTYTFDNGIYLGVWGSNVNFKDNSNATLEIDYKVGYSHKINDDFSFNIYGMRYEYPKTTGVDWNYNEYFAEGKYKILTATVAFSDNYSNSGHTSEYYKLAADYIIPAQYAFNVEGIGLGGSFGHSVLPRQAGISHDDYRVYISKTLTKKLGLSLNYTTTDGEISDLRAAKPHFFADLTASF